MDIKIDESVKWEQDGEIVEIKIADVLVAKKYGLNKVYIKRLDNDKSEINEYYDLKGKLIYSYARKSGKVVCYDNAKIDEFIVNDLISIKYCKKHKRFVTQVGTKRINSRMFLLNNVGDTLYEVKAPMHYTFYSLSENDNEIEIICQGDEQMADKFGRNDWRFSIDVLLGELIKQSLLY